MDCSVGPGTVFGNRGLGLQRRWQLEEDLYLGIIDGGGGQDDGGDVITQNVQSGGEEAQPWDHPHSEGRQEGRSRARLSLVALWEERVFESQAWFQPASTAC